MFLQMDSETPTHDRKIMVAGGADDPKVSDSIARLE